MNKIKLREIRDDFYDASSTLSAINRQISFAGIGIVWIFTKSDNGTIILDKDLYWAILFFSLALLLDLLQYVYKSIVLGCFHRCKEIQLDKNKKGQKNILEEYVGYSANFNILTWVFYISKVISTIIAYVLLSNYLFSQIKLTS